MNRKLQNTGNNVFEAEICIRFLQSACGIDIKEVFGPMHIKLRASR